MTKNSTKLVREGKYAAEVRVDLVEQPGEWAPYLTPQDAAKLDFVRKALRDGDIAAAASQARIFELTPVPAK
jgi:hypothetical protein